ncbi:hypothetical protein JOD03_001278 [Chryseomicrobium aureum]|uniref:DUF4275 family protein n=1 Tax=Chryseomicrobium aureum TaxID=1441723 RepID=UPI00195D921E|nr:DUF4275 family protein [Chryseomicrobium aureum]MBM7706375.1 hypothetical protein [Chryseomicrobium aureum]
MNLHTELLKIDPRTRVLTGWSAYLHAKWEEAFASHLRPAGKKRIYLKDVGYYSGYLWHVFSYQTNEHLSGSEAISAFHALCKKRCFVFYQHSNDAFLIEDASCIDMNILQNEEDIYLVDADFTWTFVITHETETCGPYFVKV